ncbi:MAG: helix-turn-helix transcriptional regulator [Candidatus Methylumidiphilus sp.]
MQLHELQIKIGKEIKKLRTLNEMTQEQVSEGLHLDRNAYGEIERGKTDIHLSRLVQVANFFEVEIEDLVGSKDKAVFYVAGTSNSQSNNNLYNEYNGVSAEVFTLQHELEKAQLQIDHLAKELSNHQKIIQLLEEKIADK